MLIALKGCLFPTGPMITPIVRSTSDRWVGPLHISLHTNAFTTSPLFRALSGHFVHRLLTPAWHALPSGRCTPTRLLRTASVTTVTLGVFACLLRPRLDSDHERFGRVTIVVIPRTTINGCRTAVFVGSGVQASKRANILGTGYRTLPNWRANRTLLCHHVAHNGHTRVFTTDNLVIGINRIIPLTSTAPPPI